MQACLIITDPSGQKHTCDLTKAGLSLGNEAHDTNKLPGVPAGLRGSLQFTYIPSLATWSVHSSHAASAFLKQEALPSTAPGLPLQNDDEIFFSNCRIQIEMQWQEPMYEGKSLSVIPLVAGTALTIGRATEHIGSDVGKVYLDADDARVSSEHVRISWSEKNAIIEDVSRLGTTLNGESFSSAALVFGDRIQISSYTFEFDGKALRWINSKIAGRIEARKLSRSAGGKTILNEVSLSILPGQFIGILGGSGQGKSTLLNALCGIVPASKGEVFISGSPIADRDSLRSLGIGYVPQDDIVHRELVVDDALLYAGKLRLKLPPSEIKARIDRIIEQLGLGPHRSKRVFMLSGGQRKRVSIAIELLSNPSVIFLDEPSSGLDPATEENLMALLQQLALSGKTIVCTTHVLQKAYLFDKLLFIHSGRLVFAGNSDESRAHFLGANPGHVESQEAPLEKIYAILADGGKTGEQLEQDYHNSPFYTPLTDVKQQPKQTTRKDLPRVSAYKCLQVLLQRQMSILLADKLNVAFLMTQAVAIALLVAWVSDDMGMRMFLSIVASMWFGCSNAAQQICGEVMVFRRERVCGLGLQTYYAGKVIFLSLLTSLQTLLLFCIMSAAAHWIHDVEFDQENFHRRILERNTAVGIEESARTAPDDFEVVDAEEGDAAAPADTAAVTLAASSENEPAPPLSESAIKRLATVAKMFYLYENLVESGPRDLLLENGERARDANGKLLTFEGVSVSKVLWISIGLRLGGLLAAGVIGVALGLTVSSLVRNNAQAMMWVPLILIPQILFGGFVIPYPEMSSSARQFSHIIPSFSAQRVVDVSHVYGRATPFLSNRTKTPVFLTTNGEKETFEWKVNSRNASQEYDKISPYNRSLQNLLVRPEKRGMHKQEQTEIYGTTTSVVVDTVSKRSDVSYVKGTIFTNLAPAQSSLLRLAAWAVLCYILTLFGLIKNQSGA